MAIIIVAALLGAAVRADQGVVPPMSRPRIGLVLGGGGARGAAHVGILKAIEDLGIPIDVVAGTSMGAIVGGLFASGYTADQIEHELNTIQWAGIFDDNPPREGQPWRRKRDDDSYLVKYKLGVNESGISFPYGLVQGQKFDIELSRLLMPVSGITDFNRLKIPFRAVATDIGTGQGVILDHGNLARAIRASMAVPVAFAAVEIDGRLLVDGMLANNVPVDVARQMGADIVIVVDVGEPLTKASDIKSLFGVLGQIANLMSRRNVDAQLSTLKSADVLITPELGAFSSGDFEHMATAIAIGKTAASDMQARLSALRFPRGPGERIVAPTLPAPVAHPLIEFVDLRNSSRIPDKVILAHLQVKVGDRLDRAAIERDMAALYGLELFRSVRYQVVTRGGQQGLEVTVEERSWGPGYLKFGLALSSDLEGDSLWDIGVSYRRMALNEFNGELLAAAQIGENPGAVINWNQPLESSLLWFVEPSVLYRSENVGLFQGNDRLGEFRVHRYGGQLALGRALGDWGDARVGARRYAGTIDPRIGDPAADSSGFDNAEVFAALSVDTLDNRNFPRAGQLASLEWAESVEGLGADSDWSQLKVNTVGVHTWSRLTVMAGAQFEYTADGVAPVQNRTRTGGFTRFSGFVQNQLSGQQLLLLRALAYKKMSEVKWLPVYAGASLEYGNVFEARGDISLAPEDSLLSASMFLGLDLPVGPLYLGYGHTEGGQDSLFLFLGRLF